MLFVQAQSVCVSNIALFKKCNVKPSSVKSAALVFGWIKTELYTWRSNAASQTLRYSFVFLQHRFLEPKTVPAAGWCHYPVCNYIPLVTQV